VPPPGSEPLHFANRYSRTLPQQFAICLWRNRQAYWCVVLPDDRFLYPECNTHGGLLPSWHVLDHGL
jgi:hypothetical protein